MIIRNYYYLFYKFYKLFASSERQVWAPDMCAAMIVLSLEMFFLTSLLNYYNFFIAHQESIDFFSVGALAPFIGFLVLNWFAFWRNGNWRKFVFEFDQWTEEENSTGTRAVVWFTLFIVANFAFSFYVNPPPGN